MAPRPGVRNQFWSFGTGTSFQKLAPVSKFNSGILNWGTRFQESTLAFKNRLWNHGPGQLFQEAFWLFLSQLWNFGEAPFFSSQLWNLGSGDLLSTLGSWVVFFWCKRFVLRSWLWRLWNLGPCVGLAVLSRVGSLVSNRIFASAPVLICFDQSFFGISGATCIQRYSKFVRLGHMLPRSWVGTSVLEFWIRVLVSRARSGIMAGRIFFRFTVYLSKKQF